MKKFVFVTILLAISMTMIFTQAFAKPPTPKVNPHKTEVASQGASNAHKNARMNNTNDSLQPQDAEEPGDSEVDESETPDEPDAPAAPADKPGKSGEQHGNGQGKSNFNGSVTSVTDTGYVITLKDGTEITVTLDETTNLKVPTLKDTTEYKLVAGQRVVMRTVKNEDGTYSVVAAHVIPGKPEKIHRVGEVTDYVPGVSITIMGKDGKETTFALTDMTKILNGDETVELAIGSFVTIISPRDPSGGELTANGIVVHTEDSTVEAPEEPQPEAPEVPEVPAPVTP